MTMSTPASVLAVLDETPLRIAEAVARVPARRLLAAPAPDEWSANQVLAHLRACADVWGASIGTILAEDAPTLRAVSPRRWSRIAEYTAMDFADSLDAFTAQRSDLMKTLRRLSPTDWSRSATVKGAGAPLSRTVFDFAERLARHERPHIKQIESAARTE